MLIDHRSPIAIGDIDRRTASAGQTEHRWALPRSRLTFVLVAAAAATTLASCGARSALGAATQGGGDGTLAALANACASSANGGGGVGRAIVANPLQSANETVAFTAPCHVHIAAGGSLHLVNDTITAKTLDISDDDAYAGTSVDIESSSIESSGVYGFAVLLYDARDVFRLNSSKATFEEAFFVRVDGQGPSGTGGGIVFVHNSSVLTPGPGSQGIEFVAGDTTGSADFANDTFDTGDYGAPALMFAGSCHISQVNGSDGSCSEPTARPLPHETPPPIP